MPRPLCYPSIVQIELWNALKPHGGQRGYEEMLDGLDKAKQILIPQTYEIVGCFAVDNQVVMEAKWIGKVAIPIGKLAPGEEMICHSAMFFTLANGLVVEQRNYDSFEPFK